MQTTIQSFSGWASTQRISRTVSHITRQPARKPTSTSWGVWTPRYSRLNPTSTRMIPRITRSAAGISFRTMPPPNTVEAFME